MPERIIEAREVGDGSVETVIKFPVTRMEEISLKELVIQKSALLKQKSAIEAKIEEIEPLITEALPVAEAKAKEIEAREAAKPKPETPEDPVKVER